MMIRLPAEDSAAEDIAAVLRRVQNTSVVSALAVAFNVSVSQTAEAELVSRNVTVEVTRNVTKMVETEVAATCPRGHFCNAGTKFAWTLPPAVHELENAWEWAD